MAVVLVTGAGGLVGSAAARRFAADGLDVVGIDNDLRATFFGPEASTAANLGTLAADLGRAYVHHDVDIRDRDGIERIVRGLGSSLHAVVHAAAQPSHDWAARDPHTDFGVNAVGTLNLLEAVRAHAPAAAFVFCSTNKVYGDLPNALPLVEQATRYELEAPHPYAGGIDETLGVDQCLHSVFGASKLAADVLVQEYGRYFGLGTACFRGGTLTGPAHAATELHGFLGYVMRCTMSGRPYTVFGYGGKQVRDVIDADDLVDAFARFAAAPRPGAVYNIGGGRASNASVLEAIALAQEIAGRELAWTYAPENRIGDHLWWIGANDRFAADYPGWAVRRDVRDILVAMHGANAERWAP